MARRYSWPSKRNGKPSRRIRRTAQLASGSVSALVAAVASSTPLFIRYRFEDSPANPLPRLFIGNVLLHGVDERIDQVADLSLGLAADHLFGLPVRGQAPCKTLALLGSLEDPRRLVQDLDHLVGVAAP